jgi:competence protein ComEA
MAKKSSGDISFDDDPANKKGPLQAESVPFSIESIVDKNKVSILLALIGLIIAGLGVFLFKNTDLFNGDKIEVITPQEKVQISEIIVEISGAVTNPGVYRLKSDFRIDDLMIASGGLSQNADREWVEKSINRAARLSDGQKLYIKSVNEQITSTTANNSGVYQTTSPILGVESKGLVNINTSTFEELDKLPGIGQVYGQKIIEQRPYSEVSDLLSRKVLPKSTFEKIKDLITVY